jgi:hypothetical protein
MDTKHAIVQDEKSPKHFDEQVLKSSALEGQHADYTGAEAKTDPVEIALVRKIDWRLMVCFLILYRLNTN